MNDDELTQLASAYVDDEVTAEERAQVDDDPRLLDAVDRLRAARAAVGDVEPAAISTREAHLAAALGAWDRLPAGERTGAVRDSTPPGVDAAAAAGAAAVSAPTQLSGRRRGRQPSTRWLGAAAAALVLVFGGGVALQLNSSQQDDSSTADSASTAQVDAEQQGTEEDGATEVADEPTAALENADDAGGDAAESAILDDDTFASDELEATVEADGGELDTGALTPAPPREGDLVLLLTPADVALFASDAVGAPSAPNVPAATSAPVDLDDLTEEQRALVEATLPRCLGVDIVVGPAVYGEIEVIVGVDESRDLAIAYVVPGCDEVVRARLP